MAQREEMRAHMAKLKSSPVVAYLKLILCLSVFVFVLFLTALIVFLLVC